MLPLLVRLRDIDRRIVSLLTLLVLAVPLLVRVPLPIEAFPATKDLKAFIDQMPRDKLVLIACDWDASVKGECDPLTTAMMDYLMRENRPFAIFGLIPQGPELAEVIARDLAKKHGKQYGADYLNWGYRPNFTTTLIAMMSDLPATLKTDVRDVDVTSYPMMKGIRSLKDVGLIYNVTGTGILSIYIQFCGGVPLAEGGTAVIGPELYPYLQSGQLVGLLVGLGGAAQFETITDFKDERGEPGGEGLRRMGSQSLGHLLVMVLIVLGNLGVWAERRLGRPRHEQPVDDPEDAES